jgi:ATP-dependent Clp protease ATP-binding subunit ClpB
MRRAGASKGTIEQALDRLGEAGFDPVYRAPPLKRAIRQQLENPLAQEILSGRFGPGDTIEVGADAEGLKFHSFVAGELVDD